MPVRVPGETAASFETVITILIKGTIISRSSQNATDLSNEKSWAYHPCTYDSVITTEETKTYNRSKVILTITSYDQPLPRPSILRGAHIFFFQFGLHP